MKLIHLGGKHGSIIGNYAQVSDEDYAYLNQWKWCAQLSKHTIYVRGTIDKKLIRMHRLILGVIDGGQEVEVDHRDSNGLNNTRENLRKATKAQNRANISSHKGSTSKYVGVSKRVRNNITTWHTAIRFNAINRTKSFKTEVEAALQYNIWAKELKGEFAKLNIIK